MANIVDVPAIAVPLNMFFIRPITGKSRPIIATAITLATGTHYELIEAAKPGRTFDAIDMACYFIGAAAYLTGHALYNRHMRQRATTNTRLSTPES